MNDYFDKYESKQFCNCRICKRARYEEDLVSRIEPSIPTALIDELKKYLAWYDDALSHAETQIEFLNYEKAQKLMNFAQWRQVVLQEINSRPQVSANKLVIHEARWSDAQWLEWFEQDKTPEEIAEFLEDELHDANESWA